MRVRHCAVTVHSNRPAHPFTALAFRAQTRADSAGVSAYARKQCGLAPQLDRPWSALA